jgi:hypothetical protein
MFAPWTFTCGADSLTHALIHSAAHIGPTRAEVRQRDCLWSSEQPQQ